MEKESYIERGRRRGQEVTQTDRERERGGKGRLLRQGMKKILILIRPKEAYNMIFLPPRNILFLFGLDLSLSATLS